MDKENIGLSQKVGDALELKRYIPCGYIEGTNIRTFNHPDFAKDMNTAWVLVEAMAKIGCILKTQTDLNDNGKIVTLCSFPIPEIYDNGKKPHQVRARYNFKMIWPDPVEDTHAPTAILMAAAKALGVYDD